MLQWMGGSRRKMKVTRVSKKKRQREFFDHGQEKRRRNELRKESRKLRTFDDYFSKNLHGDESLDILGLRSLFPTPAVANTEAKSDANLPDNAASRRKSGESGGVTVATSNVSDGSRRGNNQNSSPWQPEHTTKSRRIIQEQKEETDAFAQLKARAADATELELKKRINGNTDLPLPGKARNPVYVGNLQTKKVASTPRLNLSDTINSDINGDSRGKKRSLLEDYVVFSQDEINVINRSIFDQHSLIKSDRSVADWGDTRQLLSSSLELNNAFDCHPETPVTGTSDFLSRFLSTQKLKNFNGVSSHEHRRQPQERNVIGENPLLETEFLFNPFKDTHYESNKLGVFNSAFNTMDEHVKEPHEVNCSEALIDVENFHGNQEPKGFEISDPFVNITSPHVKKEHQDLGFSDPFVMTENQKVKQERLEDEYLNPTFNTGDYQVTQGFPFLTDLSYDRDAPKGGMNIFDQKKGLSRPENDLVTWDCYPWVNSLSAPSYFKNVFRREFPALGNFRSVQVRSCDVPPGNDYREFGTCNYIPDMPGNSYSHFENMEAAYVNFDKLWLPLDGFEVDTEAAFSPLGDYSPRLTEINQSNFENSPPVWDDMLYKSCTFSVQWNCESSVGWDVPRFQENPCRTRNRHDNSWAQTVAGETAGHLYVNPFKTKIFRNPVSTSSTDHLTGEINMMQCTSAQDDVMRGMDLSSATYAIIAPEILRDPEPLFVPQVNNGEDFTITCYPDYEDSPRVETNTIHLPIQSAHIPPQMFRILKSPSRIEEDIDILSSETPSNRFAQEIYDSQESGEVIAEARATTTTTRNNLLFGRENSACDMILTNHQSRKDYLLPLKEEVPSRQVEEPQRKLYSELQSLEIRRSPSNLLTIEGGEIEDGSEHHSSNSDKADPCFSSNVLNDHCDDDGVKRELIHIIEDNSLEVSTPLKEALQEDLNGMSSTKAEDTPQKRSRPENAHNFGCEASFSSQEECSPAFQLNTVQAVLCKLQRPVCSCGSKPGKPSEHGIKTIGAVLLKLQRPTRPCCRGEKNQGAIGNEALQKDIKQGNIAEKSRLETEIKPAAECELRRLTQLGISFSRGSLPLSNANKGCLQRSASKLIRRSSKLDEGKRLLSDISEQRNEKVRLSLDDIDTMASSSHQISIQPSQKEIGSKPHSLSSELRVEKVRLFAVSTGESVQYPTAASQRNQVSNAPEEEERSTRITEPPTNDAGQDCAPASQRSSCLVAPDQEQPHFEMSDPPAPTTGVPEVLSDAPDISERQTGIEATQKKEDLSDIQHDPPSTENFQQDGGFTSTDDPAYVKMLESYVVQLKFEINALRVSTGT